MTYVKRYWRTASPTYDSGHRPPPPMVAGHHRGSWVGGLYTYDLSGILLPHTHLGGRNKDSPWITPFSGQLQLLHDRKHGHHTAHSLLSSTPLISRGPLSSKLLPSPSYHDMGEIAINPKACIQLSLSSSIISVRIWAAFNWPTIVLSIWEQRDFRPVLGLALGARGNFSRNGRYR